MKFKILYILSILFSIPFNGQNLEEYLTIAESNSPELQASQFKYQSALEKIVEVGSLPNTTIGAGYFLQEAETRVGAQKAKFSIAQKMPWFGTLNIKEESAKYRANAELNVVDLVKRQLFLNVKTVYYELYELNTKKEILLENLDILKIFEELALSELENHRSTMVDVLKIRMEMNELKNQLETILELYSAKQIAFNLILNREENIEVIILDNVNTQENIEVYNKELILSNPQLLSLENLKKSLEKSELAVKKEGHPIIGVGLDYVLVDNRNIDNLIDNGKDIIMPMVTISIPLFSKKYSSKQKQLNLEQKAIDSKMTNTENQLVTIFEKSKSRLLNARETIHTQIKNIQEADSANEVLLAGYQTSRIDFEQLLEVQQLKLKFQFKKVVAEKEFGVQKSTIEFLIGPI